MQDRSSAPEADKIGGFLVEIGAMKDWQVDHILHAQKAGDRRIFGEIAIALGYVDDAAVQRYMESRSAVAAQEHEEEGRLHGGL